METISGTDEQESPHIIDRRVLYNNDMYDPISLLTFSFKKLLRTMILLDFRPDEMHDICMFVKIYFVKYMIKAPRGFPFNWFMSESESPKKQEESSHKRKRSINDELAERVRLFNQANKSKK